MGFEVRYAGRGQTIHYIDWEHPERNDFLAINQFRVDEPGGQAHKFVVPDVVLFVNGIPLVVIECKSPYITDPVAEAIEQLQRYSNQRDHFHDAEGNERLFHANQFVIADVLRQGYGKHLHVARRALREWKETEPLSRERVRSPARQVGRELIEPRDSCRRHAPTRAPSRHRP